MNDGTTTHEPKIRKATVRVNGKEYPRVIVDYGIRDGKRQRRTFKTMRQAEAEVERWRDEQKILARRMGEGAKAFISGDVQDAAAAKAMLGNGTTLTDAAAAKVEIDKAGLQNGDIHDAAAAKAILDGRGRLEEAARFFIERHFPDGGGRTAGELVEDYIESRRAAHRRPATLRDIRQRLGCAEPRNIEREGGGTLRVAPFGFAKDFAAVPVSHITTAMVEAWMEKNARKSRASFKSQRVHLVGLFNFAKKRKYIRDNPAEPIEVPRSVKGGNQPHVLSVAECKKLMLYTAKHEPAMTPYMALCLFAGIRPTETQRLDWAQIDLGRKEVFIRDDVSKTGDERYVEMADNLVQWLFPHQRPSGTVYWNRAAMARIRKDTKAKWAPDCMRHSFGSYHLAQHENASKTALQMGHRQIGTLFEHYRRAVRREDAEQFWQIFPETQHRAQGNTARGTA